VVWPFAHLGLHLARRHGTLEVSPIWVLRDEGAERPRVAGPVFRIPLAQFVDFFTFLAIEDG